MAKSHLATRNGSAVASATDRYHVPNLERALAILEYMSDRPRASGISEIAEALAFPKNSVFRIVSTLHAHGYLNRDERTKHYTLGTKLLTIGYAAIQEGQLVEHAMDIMRQVRDETSETVCVGILDTPQAQGVVLESIPTPLQVKVIVGVGTRFPLHTAAPGKAILSRLPERERLAIVGRLNMTRFTDSTITDEATLLSAIEEAGRVGYAVDNCEHDLGIRCVGAAVVNQRGYPVGALWVTGPSYRFGADAFERTGEIVRLGAAAISQRYGGPAEG